MAWVNVSGNAYIDYWSPDLVNRRWYRKLDRDTATYLYRYDQTNPDQSTLFGSAADAGLPGGLNNTAFLISDDTGPGLYNTALALTVDLAGLLLDVGRNVVALQAAATQNAGAASDATTTANERKDQVATEASEAERKRLTRQGLRALLDANAQISGWAVLNAGQLGVAYRNALGGITGRVNSIVAPLYQALQ
jgi:hypothetical protein